MKVLGNKGEKVLLLGNEAIVRGALEAGVNFVTTYPGTPASEIGSIFFKIVKKLGIYFEFSVNEKVALEAASGAAFSGLKALVAFKHFGLNVASDSFIPIVYLRANPLVIVVADDPNCWSSAQSEQDSRWYARIAKMPMLEPSDPKEAKEFVKIAFQISEKYETPVLIRITTRVAHQRSIVELNEIRIDKKIGKFQKNWERFNNLPPKILELHEMVVKKLEKIREEVSEKTNLNFVENDGKSEIGIIVSGVSYLYVKEALKKLNVELPILKLGFTYPLPNKKISEFIKKLKKVIVVEELDDILEKEVREIAKEANPELEIHGKDIFKIAGEYRVETIINGLKKVIFVDYELKENKVEIKVPKRYPNFCPGCPHRATYLALHYAIKELGLNENEIVFGGDIGCYMLSIFPPYKKADFIVSMGAELGISHGIKKSSEQKVITFIGDSTFFHAGMPGLLNIKFNNSNPIVVILDNKYTAMTGHQPHPGTGINSQGEKVEEVKIENIAKAFGFKNVEVVNPFDFEKTKEIFKKALTEKDAFIIVSRAECRLTFMRRMREKGIKVPVFEIYDEITKEDEEKIKEIGCPAFVKVDGKWKIDENLCWGCGLCAQIIKNKIRVKR